MKSFFRKWKFKHPQPKDFVEHFGLENDQAFDDLMNTTKKIDYKAVSVSESNGYDLKIENKGEVSESFELTMVLENGEETKKVKGFEGEKIIHIDAPKSGSPSALLSLIRTLISTAVSSEMDTASAIDLGAASANAWRRSNSSCCFSLATNALNSVEMALLCSRAWPAVEPWANTSCK